MSIATAHQYRQASSSSTNEALQVLDDFEAIYQRFHGRIFGMAYRMMGNADDASDVTQDAFISAYQNLNTLVAQPAGENNIHLSAWLHRIAANKCIDALRKRKRRSGVDWEAVAMTHPAGQRDISQPEVRALELERNACIQRVLNEMNEHYRLALLLHEYQGLTVREVARAMDRSESAVKSLLFRAREQFRSLYNLDQAIERAA